MSYKIVTSDCFDKELKKLAKKYASIKTDLLQLRTNLLENPMQGIPLGKDCYKIRFAIAAKNKGKSGGGRAITCVKIVNETVYLLSIYDKSEKDSLNDDELNDLLKIVGLK